MSRWVPSRLVTGGDQPFVRRLIGVSTSPLVGSIYNMGVWDKVAAAWVNVATRRTLDREEAARRRYKETGRSLENGGCIGDPHIVVDRCMVFLCILHCCMAIGRLQVAFIETRLADLPKENTDAVQRVLYRARTGVKLGATGAPDGEEARALFLAWEELGPLLDYVPEDGEWQAVVAMRDLLRELYTDKPPRGDLRFFFPFFFRLLTSWSTRRMPGPSGWPGETLKDPKKYPWGPSAASWPEIHPWALLSCEVSTIGRLRAW